MLARKISASSGVSLARNGRRPAGDLRAEVMAQHPPLQGWVVPACCRASRNLPGSAILGVLKHHAHGGELVADAVGFREVLCGTRLIPCPYQCINPIFKTISLRLQLLQPVPLKVLHNPCLRYRIDDWSETAKCFVQCSYCRNNSRAGPRPTV